MGTIVAIVLLLSHEEVFDLADGRPIKSAALRGLNRWLDRRGYSELASPFEDAPERRLVGTAVCFKNLDGRDVASFVEYVREQPWRRIESLQILVKELGAQRFRAV